MHQVALYTATPKYCEDGTANDQKPKESIITRIKPFVQSWCHKHGWKDALISAIDEAISHLSTKLTTGKSTTTLRLNYKIITEKLKMQHTTFVAFHIDESSGNAAFVRQRFYVHVLFNELDLNSVNNIT